MITPKQIVYDTLEFKNANHRTARELWTLPWAWYNYGQEVEQILKDFPSDFGYVSFKLKEESICQGDMHEIGEATDAWGCKFINLQRGIIGEVKEPLVKDDEWEDVSNVHFPEELLSFDIEQVNRDRALISDKFIMGGCPRPFEQLQFIRGTENLYMDLMYRPQKMMLFLEKMHDFYCRLMTKLAQTNIDALQFMDDWGSQKSLLISPKLWREIFKPMYREYIDIAKKYGKKTFMHSDGHILEILPDLVDMGLDAVNCQIFCMGIDNLKQFKGKITFWGEIDRQHLLPNGTVADISEAVAKVKNALYDDGGCIAQCEFGPGGRPENVREVFASWDRETI